MEDEVEVLGGHAGIRRKLPVLPSGAGAEAEAELTETLPWWCQRARPPGRAEERAGAEPVPVLTIGMQSPDVDVHGVRMLGKRDFGPASQDRLQVGGVVDLPVDRDRRR